MLHSLVKEMFTSHLERLSGLASLYRDGSPHWLPESEAWLIESEKLMARFRFAEGSRIAAARGNIAKAMDMPPGEGQSPRRQAERRCRAAAQEALDEAARLMTMRARQSEEKLQAFEEKLCEGVTAYLLQHPLVEDGITPTASGLWQGLKAYEATKALALYMETALGHQDREYLMENIREIWAGRS